MLLKLTKENCCENIIKNDKFNRIFNRMLTQLKNLAENSNELTKLRSKVVKEDQI